MNNINKKFKIAVLINSYTLEKWKHKILNDLQNSNIADMSFFLINEKDEKNSGNFLYRLYEKLDRNVFSKSGAFKELAEEENALEMVEIPNQVQNDENNFDIILNLSKKKCPDSLKKAKYGVWFFSFGDENGFLKAPFLKELYENNPLSKCSLDALIDNEEKVLYSSYSSTNPFSLYINQNKNYWKASDFVLRCLKVGADLCVCPVQKGAHAGAPLLCYPSNLFMFIFFIKLATRMFLQKAKNKFLKEQWFIAFTNKFHSFNIINPPKNRFFADPFLIQNKQKTYIFFEDYYYEKNKGVISYMEILSNGAFSKPKTVLEKDYHLSYPFVFEEYGKFYMIPETLGNRTIELYEAVDFPEQWKLKKVLFRDINAVDSTLLKYNGKYWLFTNIAEKAGYLCDELFLFYSDSLFGQWISHPKNPIVSDVRTARCAGKIFIYNGDLIRPSQETSIRYGYSLNFNKIESLSEKAYKEKTIRKIKPESIKGNLAVHTYNSENGFEIIDGMKIIGKHI
ncbi:MAG: hypothetical protein A2Y25_11440 [Candidatus Melainabacteria bacterium GWF2_37_15]|nr:MAG: hypothetical protein A2Y25_11440 [Candidatus Melainabacteria bacterium GWF2_37_15]